MVPLKANNKIVTDVVCHGILPLHEINSRARTGDIQGECLTMLMLGRIAEDVADALPDGSAYQGFWTDLSADVEDWFQAQA
jgi:hypothetical protein